MKILFLADPNSIHDLNWIRILSCNHTCYLISRSRHRRVEHDDNLAILNITYLGSIADFSTVWFWKNWIQIWKMRKWINSKKITLMHILYTEPNVLWAIHKKILGIPIIASSRGSDILITIKNTLESKSLLNLVVGGLYKSAFINCNKITSTSNQQLQLIENMGINRKNLELVRTGINTNEIDKSLGDKELYQIDRPYILFPRNMQPVYNHEMSISALEMLPDKIKFAYRFVYLDSDSSNKIYVEKIRSKMSESQLNIEFLIRQNQHDLWALINNASAIVMTNYSDGTPVTALETMYIGTPLILSPIDYDDIFQTIPRFHEFSPESIAASITNLLKNGTDYSLTESKNRVFKLCNRDYEMRKIEAIYNSVY